jgi:hypothetical protein
MSDALLLLLIAMISAGGIVYLLAGKGDDEHDF